MDLNLLIQQNNPVLLGTFILLCVLSVASWSIIFWKLYSVSRERRALQAFRARYAKLPDWPRKEIISKPPAGPAGELVREAMRLESVLSTSSAADRRDILSMHLVQKLDLFRVRFDHGLTFLASVGSSSPFIGLFGTVWGIYGALMKISAEGNAGLSVVAGPMGEALVATAAGLFAAIPAVLAYNGFVRSNRLLVQDLRHIAEQITMYFPVTRAAPKAESPGAEPVRLVREGR